MFRPEAICFRMAGPAMACRPDKPGAHRHRIVRSLCPMSEDHRATIGNLHLGTDDHEHDEVPRTVHPLDPLQLDIAGRGRPADPGHWAAGVEPLHRLGHVAHVQQFSSYLSRGAAPVRRRSRGSVRARCGAAAVDSASGPPHFSTAKASRSTRGRPEVPTTTSLTVRVPEADQVFCQARTRYLAVVAYRLTVAT